MANHRMVCVGRAAGAPDLTDGQIVLVALIHDPELEHARLASFNVGVFQAIQYAGAEIAVDAWGKSVVDFDCELGVLHAYPMRESDGDDPICEAQAVFADEPLAVAMAFADLTEAVAACAMGGER